MKSTALDRRKSQSASTTFVTVQKGTKVKLNKEWDRRAGGNEAGRKGVVTGFAVQPSCVKVQFEGYKTSQTFHISFLDVLQ